MKHLLKNLITRLQSLIGGYGSSNSNESSGIPSEFELFKYSKLLRSRKVIHFPSQSRREELLISEIKDKMKEINKLPVEEKEKRLKGIRICTLPFFEDFSN